MVLLPIRSGMLEVLMLVYGLVAVVRGKIGFARDEQAEGTVARVAGLLLMLPIVIGFVAGFLLGATAGPEVARLTDMVVPQMSGRCFADWMNKTSTGTKVIFISGYLQESLHPGDRRDQEMFFLPKPFDPEQLAAKIREALDL